MSWDGVRVPAIAAQLGCSEKTVRYRLTRFNAEGLAGLNDRSGAGRKRRITERQRSQIVELASRPPSGHLIQVGAGPRSTPNSATAGEWTLDLLTMAVRDLGIDIHRSQVRRVLLEAGVRWTTCLGERRNSGLPSAM